MKALIRLGVVRPIRPIECVVDTGAPFCVFPQKFWKDYASQIVWLKHEDDELLPSWLSVVSGLGGGAIRSAPGLIHLELVGFDGTSLAPQLVLASFASDGGRLKDPILGLGGMTFAGRRLEMINEAGNAWIEAID